MQNRICYFFLIGMGICSIVASLEATTVVDSFKGSTRTLDSYILQLGDETPRIQQNAVSAIKEMNVPDDELLLAWARLFRLLNRGRILETYENISHLVQSRDALFRLIDLDKALGGLLPLVKSSDKDQSILARFVIEGITEKLKDSTLKPSPGTVAVLAKALGSRDEEIALIASRLLDTIPSHVKDAVPDLIDALSNESQDVRSETVGTLGQIAVAIPAIQPEIIEALINMLSDPPNDESKDVRSATVSALARIAVANPAIQPEITDTLIDMLSDPPFVLVRPRRNTNSNVDVAYALAAIGPAAVPALLNALNVTDPTTRHHAAIALAKIGSEHGEKTIPILTEALASPHPATRWTVLYTFVDLAKQQPTLVNQIIQSLGQVLEAKEDTVGNRVARPDAAIALRAIAVAIPTVKPEIIEKLIAALYTPNFVCGHFGNFEFPGNLSNFHVQVVSQLFMLEPGAAPLLLNALNSTDAGVQHHAAIALGWEIAFGRMGSEHNEKTIAILAEALSSPHRHTQAQAVLVLQVLAVEPTLADQMTPIFVKMLETTTDTEAIYFDLTLHELVAGALAEINLPAITEKLQSEEPYIQRLAATAIAEVGNGGIDDPEINRRIIEILVPKERMKDIMGIQAWVRDWTVSTGVYNDE